jgi:ribosome-associated translation inhibitor RaiA/cold shock CspA family protein
MILLVVPEMVVMQQPLRMVWRGMEASPALEANIRERVRKLESFCDRIIGCRVVVEQLHRHKRRGNLFNVRVEITVPGTELVVNHEHRKDHGHEDAFVAARDAFEAMRRRLEDFVRRERGDVKSHEVPPHGRVAELYPHMHYGKLDTPDGRLIYFHRNSVVNGDFDKLEIGTEVRFVEEMGDEGPQASTVTVVGKHHIVG